VQTVGIGWQIGVPSGWGTYGTNLAAELAARGLTPEIFFTVSRPTLTEAQQNLLVPHLARQPANFAAYRAGDVTVDGPMLHALGDQLDFPPELRRLHGRPEFGVVFFESATIPQENLALAQRFAAIITGSDWNAQVLRQHGYENVRNCPQGVDLAVFAPGPRQGRYSGRFAIFAGGKLEYRKGQDLVVAAFKRFHARHPDSLLVSAWHNPWPSAAKTLSASPHVSGAPGVDSAGRLDVGGWLAANGLPPGSWVDLGPLANLETVAQLREVDVALLPSRCEGGTNLVAMECMATGVPTILSRNTGHLDLIGDGNCYPLNLQIPIGAVTKRPHMEGWGESSIEEIVNTLENAYTDRAERLRRGAAGNVFMQTWGWPAQIGRLLEAIKSFG
jgi:glycosyltransferase involved in cell wall biosynthesis